MKLNFFPHSFNKKVIPYVARMDFFFKLHNYAYMSGEDLQCKLQYSFEEQGMHDNFLAFRK
jgi:hypothetical protein